MSAAGNITRRGKASWRFKFEGAARSRDRAPQHPIRHRPRHEGRGQDEARRTGRRGRQRRLRRAVQAHRGRACARSGRPVGGRLRSRGQDGHLAQDGRALSGAGREPDRAASSAPSCCRRSSRLDIEAWHTTLRASGRKDGKGGVSTRTIKHAHRILSQALDDAVRNDLVSKNVAKLQGAPQVDDAEVQVVAKDRIGELIDKLRGRTMYARAIVALFTGMRRGEVLALRWPTSTSTPR